MKQTSRIEINPERLLKDLKDLAQFGRLTTGVSRVSFSEADVQARHWLKTQMERAGLNAEFDAVGNVHGRTNTDAKSVIIGSHTDSVPVGGWLDGSLGVIYGLEIARSIIELGLANEIGIDVISFMDEEGTYLPCLGSKRFCRELGDDELAKGQSPSGERLPDAVERSGFMGNPEMSIDRARHLAYLEAHIEQGPRLEASRKEIGIVTGIVGIRRFKLEITGEADHAGTVPMSMRKDAGAAAIGLLHSLYKEIAKTKGPESVWNAGSIKFEPGAANVVPAKAEIIFEIRDLEPDILNALETSIHKTVENISPDDNITYLVTKTIDIPPSAMDTGLSDHILRSANAIGVSNMKMPSGAGHDAMVLSRHIQSAMLFIPSINGKSHSESEDTLEEHIITGCRVLAKTVESITSL